MPARIKEWAYTGFAKDFIAAIVSIWAMDGVSVIAFFPLIFLALLVVSCVYYHKLKNASRNI